MKKVFDIHTHYTFDIPLDKTIEIFKSEFNEVGVYKTAFLSVPYHVINGEYLFDELQNLKGLYLKKAFSPNSYAFAALTHPNNYSNVKEVKKYFLNQVKEFFKVGYDGVKMLEGYPSLLKYRKQRLDDEVFDDFYAFMEENGYPIILHAANPLESWDLSAATSESIRLGRTYDSSYPSKEDIKNQVFSVMNKFPKLKLILAHFGFLTYNIKDAIRFLNDYPNTAFDITPGGEQYFEMLKNWDFWRDFIVKYQYRIYYGTDFYAFPDDDKVEWKTCFTRRPNFVRQFFETDTTHTYIDSDFNGVLMDERVLENIYYKNAEKLLGSPNKIDNNYILSEVERLSKIANKHSKYANYDLEFIKNNLKYEIFMKLNNIWGYGQLFGFSGLDGLNRFSNDFIGTLTSRKIEIRFELYEWVKVYFPIKGRVKFHAITGDMIHADTNDGEVFITFSDCDTIVGYSPVLPKIITQKKWTKLKNLNADVLVNACDAITCIVEKQENGLYKFAIAHSEPCYTIGRASALNAIRKDLEALKAERYNYFKNMPKCKNKSYERLYYKALSIQKVNVHSPEGLIPCRWTTPDRVPHKRLWLWDSVFHAFAMVTYNQEMAKDCIRAVLAMQRDDGLISAMMNPYGIHYETQPQVLAWGVWEVYKKTGDKNFLVECVNALDKYLTWDKLNRDANGNGLLEWLVDFEYTDCKSGESGQDNSPRFEYDEPMDAMDFSAFQAQDSEYLSKIYFELGNEEKGNEWLNYSNYIKNQINANLWCEEDGVYYDKLFSGNFTRVLTPSSFFPLMVGVPTKKQAEKMVKTLTNPDLLWTKLPLPTVSKNHEMYGTDMWRGGVWLNLNYFVVRGLIKYGYTDLAEELKNKTLEAVNKWYKKSGAIFEFFDSRDEVSPLQCERKGKPTNPPDWRKHVHSIVDFNWSSCFTLLFIQNEYYLD